MEQKTMYIIKEKTYEDHIDEEFHLYELPHHLTFLAGKDKYRWGIPSRYMDSATMPTLPS